MKKMLPIVAQLLCACSLFAQINFTANNTLLPAKWHFSGVPVAVGDMNGDGLDDVTRLDNARILNIQYQNRNAPFTSSPEGGLPFYTGEQWGMCVADIDNDGLGEILVGGRRDGIKIIQVTQEGTLESVFTHTTPETFVQGVNFADINGDGLLDAFVCHDDGTPVILGNNGNGTFTHQTGWIDLTSVPPFDNSGNYGSVWSDIDNDGDLDLYIAHCRLGVDSPQDPRRINQLFLNNGNGTYTQDITNASGLRIGAQSWTADFGDIDNDGDFDCFITNHDVSSQLLLNNGAGVFTDYSINSGLQDALIGLPIQGLFRDFDNDGYLDLFVTGEFLQEIYRNNGNNTFTKVQGLFLSLAMESCALGDLNHDGFQDIYGCYAEVYNNPSGLPDALWLNNGNTNNFFGMVLHGVESNRMGVGAKVRVYSPVGMQTREVRSGESYGISNSQTIHVGLGQATVVDSVVVFWPSGNKDILYNPSVNQYLTLTEGGCLLPDLYIEALGPTSICTGESVVLRAPEGYVYNWSNGAATRDITVTTAGAYRVTLTASSGCTLVTNSVNVVINPVEKPVVTLDSDVVLCKGDNVLLSASPATAYLWSTGETTASITVSNSGSYTVSTQGLCATFVSDPVAISFLDAQPPVVTPATVLPGNTATLTATGDMPQWYDAVNSPAPIFEGNTFITPPLDATTTYWVSTQSTTPLTTDFVGPEEHEGFTTGSSAFNGGLYFTCFEPVFLSKVKVYSTKAGLRKIDLRDNSGVVIRSATIDIPLGEHIIDLNFDIPTGFGYLLTTDQTVNQANLGSIGPRFRRTETTYDYPFVLPGKISIFRQFGADDSYYYFYNWEIGKPEITCSSDRIPVTASVQTSATQMPEWMQTLDVFPNPVADITTLRGQGYTGQQLSVQVRNAQGGVVLPAKNIPISGGTFELPVSMQLLPAGIYWLEVLGEQGLLRRKIIRS